MMTQASRTVELPFYTAFPRNARDLITQVKLFTGKDVVMDPHWRATPTLWIDPKDESNYRAWLRDLQNKDSRGLEAFVYTIPDMGAYIVYGDHGTRWTGELDSIDPQSGQKADTLCHEIAHILVRAGDHGVTPRVTKYFNEQCAVTGGSMLKTVVGCRYGDDVPFPIFKECQTPAIQRQMDYDYFSVYTRSPLANYYEEQNGRNEGVNRFLSPAGIIRFDIIARDVERTENHFATHFSHMDAFSKIAAELAYKRSLAHEVNASLDGIIAPLSPEQKQTQYSLAVGTLFRWWSAVSYDVRSRGYRTVPNIYAGESSDFSSREEAENYHTDLFQMMRVAARIKPQDRFLKQLLTELGGRPMLQNQGQLESQVTLRFDEQRGVERRYEGKMRLRFNSLVS